MDVIGLDGGTVDVSVGDAHACAITSGGAVKCWGGFNLGLQGLGCWVNGSEVSSAIPVDVTGLTGGVIALAAGANHTCALKNDGTVMCWGDNSQGQLGV